MLGKLSEPAYYTLFGLNNDVTDHVISHVNLVPVHRRHFTGSPFQSKMSEDGSHTMPKRNRKESVLGPVSKIVPGLRKQSAVIPPLPHGDILVSLVSFIFSF